MEKSSSSCKVPGCEHRVMFRGYCDKHYRMIPHRPYTTREKNKLFELLPIKTQKKLATPKKVCCVCRKPVKWPNIVMYKFTKRMCKECWKLTKEATDDK